MSENPTPQPAPRSRLPFIVLGMMAVSVVMVATMMFSDTRTNEPRTARIPEGGGNPSIGWEVPDFTATLLDGTQVQLSDYRGKVVFVNFWATWCIPCQREMPAFVEFMGEGRDDAAILAINHGEETRDIVRFLRPFGAENLHVVLDSDFQIADGFGVMNLPTTFVLDGDGVVRGFRLGEINHDDLEAYVRQLS